MPDEAFDEPLVNDDGRFGRALKLFRKKQNLTQQELGNKAGLTGAAVSRIERGERAPSLESHSRLCMGLGMREADVNILCMPPEDDPDANSHVIALKKAVAEKLGLRSEDVEAINNPAEKKEKRSYKRQPKKEEPVVSPKYRDALR